VSLEQPDILLSSNSGDSAGADCGLAVGSPARGGAFNMTQNGDFDVESQVLDHSDARPHTRRSGREPVAPKPGFDKINHIIVLYLEDRSFDDLWSLRVPRHRRGGQCAAQSTEAAGP
jgi:hypothetical protein